MFLKQNRAMAKRGCVDGALQGMDGGIRGIYTRINKVMTF